MTLAAKTDSPLPLLFGWAVNSDSPGLQLASQIQWGAFRELFCSPSYPLVLSLGTDTTLGKSYLLQYLYALQECHFRGPTNPLRIHSMPSIDIIGDFAREECMRGVTLADVHGFSASDPLCRALTATLQSFATATLLHASLKTDFEADGQPKTNLQQLLSILFERNSDGRLLLLLRDAEDDHGPAEQRRVLSCVQSVAKSLRPEVLKMSVAWLVTPLASLGPTELTNEVKSLRKSRGISLATLQWEGGLSLEEALAMAPKSTKKFPPMPVLQQRYVEFVQLFEGQKIANEEKEKGQKGEKGRMHSSLAQRVLSELDPGASCEGLLAKLFPVAQSHQLLTNLIQEKVRCLGRGKEYLEPEERRLLESNVDSIDREIGRLRLERQRAPPHALLRTFAHLVLTGAVQCKVKER